MYLYYHKTADYKSFIFPPFKFAQTDQRNEIPAAYKI